MNDVELGELVWEASERYLNWVFDNPVEYESFKDEDECEAHATAFVGACVREKLNDAGVTLVDARTANALQLELPADVWDAVFEYVNS